MLNDSVMSHNQNDSPYLIATVNRPLHTKAPAYFELIPPGLPEPRVISQRYVIQF